MVLADGGIESANIVGYQDFVGEGSFNLTADTFQPVADGAAFTLKDIKVNDSFDYGSDYVTFYNSKGNKEFQVTYLGKDDADDEGVEEGWYLTSDFDDWEFKNCKNSEPLAGYGIVFNRGISTSAIRFAGEVKDDVVTINGTGNFNIVGNATPVDITLGDITVNSNFDYGSDYVTFYNNKGNKEFQVTYLGTADAEDEGVEAGWYLTSDFDDWEFKNCKNSFAIPAGNGFVFNRGIASSAIILPNPLAK